METLKRRKSRGYLSPSGSILKDKVDDKGLLESLQPDLLYSNFEEEQIHQGICFLASSGLWKTKVDLQTINFVFKWISNRGSFFSLRFAAEVIAIVDCSHSFISK